LRTLFVTGRKYKYKFRRYDCEDTNVKCNTFLYIIKKSYNIDEKIAHIN